MKFKKKSIAGHEQLTYIALFIAFFLVVLSYDTQLGLGSIKYISIAITLSIAIIHMHGRISRTKAVLILVLLTILTLSCLFQPTSMAQKLTSFTFYITLLAWTFLGDEIFTDREAIIVSVAGVCVGMLFVLISTWPMMYVQLADVFNVRHRVWWGFSHPNTVGSMASAVIIGIAAYLFLSSGKVRWLQKTVLAAIIVGMLIILNLTNSRTSLVSIIIFFSIMFASWIFKRVGKMSKVIIALVGLILVIVGSVLFVRDYALRDTAFNDRLYIFQSINNTPRTFFVGNGMVDVESLNTQNANGGSTEIAAVTLFYKNGIIGILAYVVIFGELILKSIKVGKYTQRWLAYALLAETLIGSIGEAFIVNITNVSPMLILLLISSVIFNKSLQNGDLSERYQDNSIIDNH